jgi:hypothetical protein
MTDLIEKLRESRKSYTVLLHQITSFRSIDNFTAILIFEGPEDIGVYETWIRRCTDNTSHELMSGNGKQQLMDLYSFLVKTKSELFSGVFIFVDRDFDVHENVSPNLFVLDAYSIENILCSEEALKSILYDELAIASKAIPIAHILEKFHQMLESFEAVSRELNLQIFMLRRLKLKISKKPDKASEFCEINLDSISKKYSEISELMIFDSEIDANQKESLECEYFNLTSLQSQRGKYVLSFFRIWLELLTNDLKSQAPVMFTQSNSNIKGEPWNFKLRRLAICSPIPNGFLRFIKGIEENALKLI